MTIQINEAPNELKELNQWVLWKYIPVENKKPKKVPFTNSGKKADTTDPSTWLSFNKAIALYQTGDFDGIGFVFKSPHCGIDLDDVIDSNGNVLTWAQDIINQCDSYTECSPSKKGFHIIIQGKKPDDKCKKKFPEGHEIEIYDHHRFFTFTGDIYNGQNTIKEKHFELNAIYYSIFPKTTETPAKPPHTSNISMSDEQVIENINRSKQCEKFDSLYNGDGSGYGTPSEADFALASILTFWTRNNPDQIESIMASSRLSRPKWSSSRGDVSYLRYTINNACKQCTEIYNPGHCVNDLTDDDHDDEAPQENSLYAFPNGVMSGVAEKFANLYSEKSELNKTHLYFSFLTVIGNYLSPYLSLAAMGDVQPRLYTLLLGESDSKKSAAISQTVDFFEGIFELNTLLDLSSGEGLLNGIQNVQEEKKQMLIVIDELAAIIQKATIKNSSLASHLCTLYEKTAAQNNTKNDSIKVKNAFVSMLAACTFETFENTWNDAFTQQGLTNRFFMVPGQIEQHFSLPLPINQDVKSKLQNQVKCLAEKVGINHIMKLDDDAFKLYDKWYRKMKSIDLKTDDSLTKRIEWHVLKLSMVIALSDGKYTIDLETIRKGILIGKWQIGLRKRLKPIQGDNVWAQCENKIIKVLSSCKTPITKSKINTDTNIKNRQGIKVWENSMNNLLRDGDIIKVTKGKKQKYWLKQRELPQGWEV